MLLSESRRLRYAGLAGQRWSELFVTCVSPLLEYCTPVWSLYSVGMIFKRVESLQQAFTMREMSNMQETFVRTLPGIAGIKTFKG